MTGVTHWQAVTGGWVLRFAPEVLESDSDFRVKFAPNHVLAIMMASAQLYFNLLPSESESRTLKVT